MKHPFDSDITLENDIALLRPLLEEDFGALLPYALQEPELWKYSLMPGDGEDNLKSYLGFAHEEKAKGTSYPFLVIDKRSNEVAGSTRFYDYQPYHATGQLGYTWYGKRFQGTGLNKNCKLLLLNHAFESMQVERVEFRADAKNERSIAAMKSIGCTPEGILRNNCRSEVGRRDSIVLSILKDEWFGGLGETLRDKIGLRK